MLLCKLSSLKFVKEVLFILPLLAKFPLVLYFTSNPAPSMSSKSIKDAVPNIFEDTCSLAVSLEQVVNEATPVLSLKTSKLVELVEDTFKFS